MFKKIIIAEDQQSVGKGLQSILEDLTNARVQTCSYCDDALLKIKASLKLNESFDLLVTDLSFQEDYLQGKITSGELLISKVKKIQPDLKIIVFSVDNSVSKIKKLVEGNLINAFVSKGRRESEELSKAISAVSMGKVYYSEDIEMRLNNSNNILELTTSDKLILELLANGVKQNKLSDYFKENKMPSSSKRSIEYRIEYLKINFNAETIPHLISIAKDIGLI